MAAKCAAIYSLGRDLLEHCLIEVEYEAELYFINSLHEVSTARPRADRADIMHDWWWELQTQPRPRQAGTGSAPTHSELTRCALGRGRDLIDAAYVFGSASKCADRTRAAAYPLAD